MSWISESATSSLTVLIPSRLRQLYERTERSRSSIGIDSSEERTASTGAGPISMPSAAVLSSRARPKSSTSVRPADATATRGVIAGFVSTSTTRRSKSVRSPARVASTRYVTFSTGE